MKLFIQFITLLLAFTVASPMPSMAASNKVQPPVSRDDAKININEFDAKTITRKLNGIGKSKATAIVNYREQFGPFKSVDDLIKVKGISKQLLGKIRSGLVV